MSKNYDISTWFKPFNYTYHFNCIKNIYLSLTLLFTQGILTLVHPLNTIYQIIYFKTVWVGWGPHTQFLPWQPFHHVKKIMSQHDSNHSNIQTLQLYQKYLLESTLLFTQYILTLVHSLNTIYQIIYFTTVWVGWGPHTQFIPQCPFCHVKKNYVSTWFKLLNYIYHFNCTKNIYLTLTIFFTQYILTPVHPLNTIYQIIYFNILWLCRLLVYTCKPLLYTCKPLLYTKKNERKMLPPQCPAKLWEEQL